MKRNGALLAVAALAASAAFAWGFDAGVLADGSVHPAIVDSEIGSEQALDDDPVYAPSGSDERVPAVAYDGTNYLVVWESLPQTIRGARVDSAGNLLDTAGFTISYGGVSPTVAYGATAYVVAWESEGEVRGIMVGTDGALSGSPFTVTTSAASSAAVAFDGSNFLFVWSDIRGGVETDIYCARVTPSGTVLDTDGVPLATAGLDQMAPAVAFSGSTYLVAWMDYRSGSAPEIYGQRVNTNGTLAGANFAITASVTEEAEPALAYGGGKYLLVWEDWSGTSYDVRGQRLETNGALAGGVIGISTTDDDQGRPAVAFGTSTFLVVWQDSRAPSLFGTYGQRVATDGTLPGGNFAVSSTDALQLDPALARGSGEYLVVWNDLWGVGDSVVCGRRVTAGGTPVGSEIVASMAANAQSSPSIAYDGTNNLGVWLDGRDGSTQAYGARVDRSGAVLDLTPIPIAAGAVDGTSPPVVAFGGGTYLVAWAGEDGDLHGQRVSASGTLVGGSFAITIGTGTESQPAIAFDGGRFLVAWQDDRNGNQDIYAQLVNTDGTLSGSDLQVTSGTGDEADPAVAYGAGQYLMAWEDPRGIYGQRVATGGSLAGPEIAVCDTPGYGRPAVASDGTRFLVVAWEWSSLRARLVGSSGTLGTPVDINPDGGPTVEDPAVVFDGTNYLAMWAQCLGAECVWPPLDHDVYGARVHRSGALLDPTGFAIAAGTTDERAPAAANNGPGNISALAYQRFDTSEGIQTDRAFARTFHDNVAGEADTGGDHWDEIGVFRNGMWFLTSSSDYAGVDLVRAFGSPVAGADDPLIGEFGCLAAGGGYPDGLADLAVLRKQFSTWMATLSPDWANAPDLVKTFGTTAHKRIATRWLDTNGDGCSDIGVFRNGCFHVLQSPDYASLSTPACFGPGTDTPLAADLDGDGQSDLILWRQSSAHYSYRLSSESFATDHGADLGAGDSPIVGDMNGDGRIDLGSYASGASTFRFTYSPDFVGVDLVKTHGVSGDVPIVADVNGDGTGDIGIFRNAIARWWFLGSPGWTSTCLSTSFGTAGDIPIYGKPPGTP